MGKGHLAPRRKQAVRVQLIPDTINLEEYLREPDPGERVIAASSLFEEVRDEFLMPQTLQGARPPWPKAESLIRFRCGELSMWSGTNYTGKSVLTSQVALALCQQDERVCMASFEMKPRKTMYRMTRQAAGGPEPTVSFMRSFHQWTDGRLWIFDHIGRCPPERVMAVIRWCRARLGITHFFIDSMMKVVRGEDDYNGQKDFCNDLQTLAQDTGMHIHLVHHTKKPADESHRPTRFDAKGSGAISDQVDNAFNVWRNKPKETKLARTDVTEKERDELEASPDTLLICDKQRNGEWDGNIKLWFDSRSFTFRGEKREPWTFGIDIPLQEEPGALG